MKNSIPARVVAVGRLLPARTWVKGVDLFKDPRR